MFQECKTLEEKKKLYRRLSKHLHPDCGGEDDLMSLLTRTFENSCKPAFSQFGPDPDDFEDEEDDEEAWNGLPSHETKRVRKNSEKTFIIDIILRYAKENPPFKTDFVESIKKYLEENGSISAKQYNCLVDLYYQRKIDKWVKKK